MGIKITWFGDHDVNQWSLVPIQCQQESPMWGTGKKETLFNADSLTVIQLNYEAAGLWGGPGDRPPSASTALLWSGLLRLRGNVCSEPE